MVCRSRFVIRKWYSLVIKPTCWACFNTVGRISVEQSMRKWVDADFKASLRAGLSQNLMGQKKWLEAKIYL